MDPHVKLLDYVHKDTLVIQHTVLDIKMAMVNGVGLYSTQLIRY